MSTRSSKIWSNGKPQNPVRTVHEKLKPFECQVCSSTFRLENPLKIHIRAVYETMMPFECPLSLTIFGQNSSLKTPLKTVHKNLKPYECQLC